MRLNRFVAPAVFAFVAINVRAAPVPQLAGEGAACNSILSSTDNGVGYGVDDAEDNVAGNISQVKGAVPGVPAVPAAPPVPRVRRQLAGEGAASDSVLSSTDNGVGYGVEDAEDNIAGNISDGKGIVGGAGAGAGGIPLLEPAPAPAPVPVPVPIPALPPAIGDAAGIGAVTSPATGAGDTLDGLTTGSAANAGGTIGDTKGSCWQCSPTILRASLIVLLYQVLT